ncbi:MAG: PilZ domain-containing protein [Desulfobacterales bacterium]
MDSKSERRKSMRWRVAWPVNVHTNQGDFVGETITVSETGISIYCDEPLSLKKVIQLTIFPPDHEAIRISGEIVWSDLFGIDDRDDVVGFGIFFIKISDADRRHFREVVSAQTD